MRRLHWTIVTLAPALLMALPGCADREIEPQRLEPRALHAFEGCEDMLAFTKEHALELLEAGDGYYGGGFGGGFPEGGGDEGAGSDGGDTGGGDSAGDPGGPTGGGNGDDFSDTNVQEAGVDEPDLVKTDGDRILALAQGRLHYVDTTDLTPVKLGHLQLPNGWNPKLFLVGDRALVMQHLDTWELDVPDAPDEWSADEWSYVQLTQLIEVDLSDPAGMRVVDTLTVGGDMVDARMVDGVVRAVIRSHPVGLEFRSWWDFYEGDPWGGEDGGEPWPGTDGGDGEDVPGGDTSPGDPTEGGAPEPEPLPDMGFAPRNDEDPEIEAAKAQARAHNEAVLDASTPENWLPQFVLERENGSVQSGLLYNCEQAMRPGEAAGIDVVSVLTIDLQGEMDLEDGVGVFSTGETVYASKESLYVATHPWTADLAGGDGGVVTEPGTGAGTGAVPDENSWVPRSDEAPQTITSYIHKFDTTDPARATYVASGGVRGRLLNQFAMSELDGHLRVATTDQWQWGDLPQESWVTVLADEGESLETIGQVGGLGLDERIYAVRFIGDIGYVVTFRETDPLYTVDLSDPTTPTVRGELKINGYSAYLHPMDETHLIGIGQDATESGQTLGTQVSIFDVSDLDAPTRTHQFTLGEGWSEAEYDHHAFLYWAPRDLAVFPLEWWNWDGMTEEYFQGAVALRVSAEDGIVHLADLQHPVEDWGGMPRRSLVIGEQLFTVSDMGLEASSLEDFSDMAWVPWE